jgi:hypothetical protein
METIQTNEARDLLAPKMTLTVSTPLPLYLWLKQSQRNVSRYVIEAVEERRRRDEEAESAQ